jgi:hypothetical protein
MKSTTLLIASSASFVSAFVPANTRSAPPSIALQMGLFDGVKEAFGADGMGELDGDRETPIDRWMGWNAKKDDSSSNAMGSKGECLVRGEATIFLELQQSSDFCCC